MPVADRAIPTSDSSAALTASLLGKIFANSGVSSTRLLPFWYAAKCLPRTPFPRSSRRYSARISSTFFIDAPFMFGGQPGADQSNRVSSFSIDDRKNSTHTRHTESQPAFLTNRMIRVRKIYAIESPSTDAASSKLTLCFLRFRAAFAGSASNLMLHYFTGPNTLKPHAVSKSGLMARRRTLPAPERSRRARGARLARLMQTSLGGRGRGGSAGRRENGPRQRDRLTSVNE